MNWGGSMRKKNYYLVARNRDTNDFKILKVYGERGNSLERIDYATSKYTSYEELIDLLYSRERIDSKNYDLFIAYKGNNKEMKYLELIYNSKNDRVADLKSALINSSNGDMKKSPDAKRIVDKFCQKMEYNDLFYHFIMNGNTNLYKKFIKYFEKTPTFGLDEDSTIHSKPMYSVKYADGAWVMDSYLLIRNIVEAFNRFDQFTEKENRDYLNENVPYRKMINNRLMRETSKDFVEGQMNIFDYIEQEQMISEEDRLIEVMSTIDSIDIDTFIKEKNKIVLNEEKFASLDEIDLLKLKTLIRGKLLEYIYEYCSNKYDIELGQRAGLSKDKIIDYLRRSKNLDNAYNWCLIYNKYLDKDPKVYKKDTK